MYLCSNIAWAQQTAVAADAVGAVGDAIQGAPTTTLDAALRGRSWMASQPRWPCQYRGRFEQTRELSEAGLALTSGGRFWQNCKRGLIWQVDTPRPEARVYTRSQIDLTIGRRGRVRAIDGLVERRVGVLLRSVFGGDHAALAKDFIIADSDDGAVRLQPKDARMRAHLNDLFLGGDAQTARVLIKTPSDTLQITLDEFVVHDGATKSCEAWLEDTQKICAALRAPLQVLEAGGRN